MEEIKLDELPEYTSDLPNDALLYTVVDDVSYQIKKEKVSPVVVQNNIYSQIPLTFPNSTDFATINEFLTAINNLAVWTVGEIEIVYFKSISPVSGLIYYIELLGVGKGQYGAAHTQLSSYNLEVKVFSNAQKPNAYFLARANHTGTQLSSTISDFVTEVNALITYAKVIAALGFTPENLSKKGAANGYVPLNASSKIEETYLPDSIVGQMEFISVWNAFTNSPTIPTAATANKGWYYIVNVDGSTSVGGISDWKVGDWLVSNGTTWSKIDNTDAISSFNGRTGAITFVSTDLTDILFGTFVNALTTKSTIVNNDLLNITDSADSNKQKKVLFSVLKAMVLANSALTGPATLVGSTATSGTDVLLDLTQTWNTASTPTAIKLSVTETITASNGAMLLDFKVNGVTVFSVSRQGNVVIAGTLALSNQILQSIWESSGANAPSRLRFKGTNATGLTPRGLIVENAASSNNINHSTGTFDLISTDTGFGPTSGTGSFTFLLFGSIINQTGGANGIIRGFFVNPTLTSLIGEFRALDIQSGKLVFSSTIIAPGTTGAQTINKISGKVNAAAGTTSLVVTNNLVTASSIVMCQMGTNDSTCRITSVVEAAGSFTINYIAPTAETVIKFKVIN
jgi:hypothetical protein